MKNGFTPLLLAAALVLPATVVAQSPEQQQRIAASFVLALGRAPSAAEIESWSKLERASVSDLVARHRQQLQSDTALKHAVAAKAFRDAFGREPVASELASDPTGGATYTELMNRHIEWLADRPADYSEVIDRAYQLVVRRSVYTEEIDYWKPHGTLPFALLVGCIEDWARRNQPGLMVTAGRPTVGVNSTLLTTVRLSTAVAVEARAAIGLSAFGEWNGTTGFGRNLIAAGAGDIVTGGRIHFVAAGGDNLMPASSKD